MNPIREAVEVTVEVAAFALVTTALIVIIVLADVLVWP